MSNQTCLTHTWSCQAGRQCRTHACLACTLLHALVQRTELPGFVGKLPHQILQRNHAWSGTADGTPPGAPRLTTVDLCVCPQPVQVVTVGRKRCRYQSMPAFKG